MMGNWSNWQNMMNWDQPGFRTGFTLLALWSLFWKGLALWKAARNDQRYWYVALLLINLAGILEILYLFVFAKEKFVLVSEPIKSKTKRPAKK